MVLLYWVVNVSRVRQKATPEKTDSAAAQASAPAHRAALAAQVGKQAR